MGDETTAVIPVVISGEGLQLKRLRWVNFTERVLPILNVLNSDPPFDAHVCSCVKATGVHGRAHIVFNALDALADLDLVLLLQGWTHGGTGGFPGAFSVIS